MIGHHRKISSAHNSNTLDLQYNGSGNTVSKVMPPVTYGSAS